MHRHISSEHLITAQIHTQQENLFYKKLHMVYLKNNDLLLSSITGDISEDIY